MWVDHCCVERTTNSTGLLHTYRGFASRLHEISSIAGEISETLRSGRGLTRSQSQDLMTSSRELVAQEYAKRTYSVWRRHQARSSKNPSSLEPISDLSLELADEIQPFSLNPADIDPHDVFAGRRRSRALTADLQQLRPSGSLRNLAAMRALATQRTVAMGGTNRSSSPNSGGIPALGPDVSLPDSVHRP